MAEGAAITSETTIPNGRSVRFPLVPKKILNISTQNKTKKRITSPARTPEANGSVCPLKMKTRISIRSQKRRYH